VIGVARTSAAAVAAARPIKGHAFLGTIHRAKTTSHVEALGSDHAAAVMHRRLHVNPHKLRALPSLTSDAPECLAKSKPLSCAHCTEANATHVPHAGSGYTPSHVGRAIHADIVGPFRRSIVGKHQYMLVLIDDHSRFKAVYFMQAKSEAPDLIKRYVAQFNAYASRGKDKPVRIVGTLHCDNAGEFLSREFQEFLEAETIHQTTCPPHVHSLNGVAERAIRSIMEHVRSDLVASNAPIGFWTHAAEHAVDVLNRTTGPPGSNVTAKPCRPLLASALA
jgi:transposase InsO family protein